MATLLTGNDVEAITRRLYRTDLSAKGQILTEYNAQLSEADLAQYRDQGYLAMEGIFAAEEIESFKNAEGTAITITSAAATTFFRSLLNWIFFISNSTELK